MVIKHIQDWYRGYQCGVAAAEGSGYPFFHDVPVGPQAPVINKDGCGACYSPTGCLCEDVGTPSMPPQGELPEIPALVQQQPDGAGCKRCSARSIRPALLAFKSAVQANLAWV